MVVRAVLPLRQTGVNLLPEQEAGTQSKLVSEPTEVLLTPLQNAAFGGSKLGFNRDTKTGMLTEGPE